MSNTVQSKPTSIQAQDIQRYAQQGQDRAIKARNFSLDSTQPDKQENIKQLANCLVDSIDSKTQSQNQAVSAGNLPKPTPPKDQPVSAGNLPKPTPPKEQPVSAGNLPKPTPKEPPVVAGGLAKPQTDNTTASATPSSSNGVFCWG